MRTWGSDHPKAALMTRKRDAIVSAALRAFLAEGYEGSSVNRIAEDAGVSIKTLYRHFTDKDDLFGAAIIAACTPVGGPDGEQAPWLPLPPDEALPMMGEAYLRDILEDDQIRLYRVVVHDSGRVPVMGRLYQTHMIASRRQHFIRYAKRWAARAGWPDSDWRWAAEVFGGLLDAETLSAALVLNERPDDDTLVARARRAASDMLFLITSGRFVREQGAAV